MRPSVPHLDVDRVEQLISLPIEKALTSCPTLEICHAPAKVHHRTRSKWNLPPALLVAPPVKCIINVAIVSRNYWELDLRLGIDERN